MLFTSYPFLFIFLPIVISLYYFIKKLAGDRVLKLFMITISIVFYGIFYPGFLLLLISSITLNMIISVLIVKTTGLSKFFFIIGIAVNMLGLLVLKNAALPITSLEAYFPQDIVALELVLPLGIGFLTFIQISYLLKAYKKDIGTIITLDYFLKCTFFPSFVIGPVYKAEDNLIANEKEESFDHVAYGIYILIIGLFKMVVLADSFYIYFFNGMNINNPGLLTTWFTMLSFTFQIYFYCSGYCDMAAGIGKMFGLSIPFNFLSPYKATSLSEFTNRWHTSLTGIIRDLIYTPLTSKRKNIVISCIAIITSIIIGSFWFGNSLNVLICGFLYGCLLCLGTLFGKLIRHIPKRIRGGLTFLTINLLFILLSTESISKAVQRYKGLINFNNLGIDEISRLTAEGSLYFPNLINIVYFLVYFLLGIGICFFGKNTKEMMKSVSFTTISAMGLGLLLLIIVIHMTRLEFLF